MSGCSFTKFRICSHRPSDSVPAEVAKNALDGTSSVMQSRRFCTRRSVSSKQRYSVVPPAVFRSHIGSPFAIRTHRSSTHHDLPIFDAPPRMHNPCGSSVSTQNFVGGSFMSIKVSPSITASFVFSSAILKSPCKKVRAKAAAAEPMLSLSYLSNG